MDTWVGDLKTNNGKIAQELELMATEDYPLQWFPKNSTSGPYI